MASVRVIAIDSQPIVLDGMIRLLAEEPDLDLIATAQTASDAFGLVTEWAPDVVVLDLRLADQSAPEVCRRLQLVAPGTRVMIFTASEELETLATCRRYGACGVVSKTSRELVEAIRRVAAGGEWWPSQKANRSSILTSRELDVLLVMSRGGTSRQIAKELDLSHSTVRGYVQTILQKLGAHSRIEALALARKRKIL